jgi:TonB-linked SusC/RagA family outer membrane protein
MTKISTFSEIWTQFLHKIGILTFLFICSLSISAQQKGTLIQGKVLDEKNNDAIIGARIEFKGRDGQKKGVVSDINGNFSIETSSLPVTFIVNSIGYKQQEFDVYDYSDPITIFLTDDAKLLNEVVVVGYGTQKRKELTGSISSIPESSLSQVTPSFDNLLTGAVAGLSVTESSGQPGATSSIRIRGGNSINGGNEPLYVIDGFIVYNDNANSQTGVNKASAELNVLATINPSDIESIEVLKDASATAIYGSRGANGVILITTKKGKKGSNHVTYETSFGWQQISKEIKLLNGAQWEGMYNDVLASGGQSPAFTPAQISQVGSGSDWESAALRKGNIISHQISITGGDEKTRYAISGNYYNQQGILLNTGFERYSGRINFDTDVFDNLKIGVNAIGSQSTQNGLTNLAIGNGDVSNTWVEILRAIPIIPIYNKDGSFNYTNPYSETTMNGVSPNPISDLVNTINQTTVTRTLGNFFANYKIIPSLSAKINVGADLLSTKQDYFAPSYTSDGIMMNGFASVGDKVITSYQGEFTLNYDKQLDDKNYLNVLAGYTKQTTNMESAVASASNFGNNETTYNSLQSASVAGLPGSSSSTAVLDSYLGRINYSFLHRYNLTTTLRADGSSRFAEDHKWGYFPSVGLSWNINDEPFFKNYSQTTNNLKLRVSAGTTGNQEIGNYQYLSQVVPETYSLNGKVITGEATTNIQNPDLRWESTKQYDAGLDWGVWKDRLTVALDFYYKDTYNLLLNEPIPATSGYSSALTNVGEVSNKGAELSINANIIKGKGTQFNWEISASVAKNVNEVLNLGGLTSFQPTYTSTAMNYVIPTIVEVGQPLGSFYGYKFNGIVQNGDNLAKVPVNSWQTTPMQAGDPKFIDVNGDGKIDANDRVLLGNSQPKFTYGFANTFTYKNFDLSIILQGSYGNKLYNALANRADLTSLYYNSLETVTDRWTSTNPSNTVSRAVNTSAYYLDSRYIEDASYLNIKSLTLGYKYAVKIGNQKEKTQFKFSLTAQNLFTFTKYSGSNPQASQSGGNDEQSSLYQGIDYGAYPTTKTFLFGLGIIL